MLKMLIVVSVTGLVLSACGGLSEGARVITASGEISRQGEVKLDPWYHITVPPMVKLPSTAGAYTIEAVNALSQTLASQGFDASFTISVEGAPSFESEWGLFKTAVAFPPGTAAFRIKHGEQVLRVVPVSPHAPTLTVTAPTSGQAVSGYYTVTWQSSDVDGGPLYHYVEYSHNGQDWFVLEANLTTTQAIENFDQLPGSTQARIRVRVTDGINTTEATSPAFVVSPKPPEVFIEHPKPGAQYMFGMNVPLGGWADDPQDGNLYSEVALVWSSDRDGILGRGRSLNLETLSAGPHTITLSATNSLGLTGSASVTITIEMPPGTSVP